MRQSLKRILGELPEKDRLEAFTFLSDQIQDAGGRKELNLEPISAWQDEIDERLKYWDKLCGIESGYTSIDAMTRGLAPSEMTVIAGKTSYGKTTLALNITAKVASEAPVAFVTLEMSKPEVGVRLQQITRSKDLYALPVLVQAQDELDWQDVDILFEKAAKADAKLVVIDHLHYFTRELEHVAEDLGRVTKEIKKNALRYNLPVILISHVRKTDKTAGIDDLRGSSYIAQDADIVLMVNRDPETPKKLYVKLEKNRNRGPKRLEASFDFDGVTLTEPSEYEVDFSQ